MFYIQVRQWFRSHDGGEHPLTTDYCSLPGLLQSSFIHWLRFCPCTQWQSLTLGCLCLPRLRGLHPLMSCTIEDLIMSLDRWCDCYRFWLIPTGTEDPPKNTWEDAERRPWFPFLYMDSLPFSPAPHICAFTFVLCLVGFWTTYLLLREGDGSGEDAECSHHCYRRQWCVGCVGLRPLSFVLFVGFPGFFVCWLRGSIRISDRGKCIFTQCWYVDVEFLPPTFVQLTGCSHLLFCVIYPHLQDRATELHRPIQRKKTCLVDFAATVAVFVFFRHWVCPSSEWFTFIQLLAEPLSYIGRTPEKKIELIRRRGAGQVSELWRYICRKLMRLHKWMTCCEKVLLACEVFPQIFVQCRSLICPYLLHESLTWKERLLHISILKCSHRHPHLHVSPRSGVFFCDHAAAVTNNCLQQSHHY